MARSTSLRRAATARLRQSCDSSRPTPELRNDRCATAMGELSDSPEPSYYLPAL